MNDRRMRMFAFGAAVATPVILTPLAMEAKEPPGKTLTAAAAKPTEKQIRDQLRKEAAAWRSAANMKRLSAADRKRIGTNPAGQVQAFTTANMAALTGCCGTFSNGVGCHGTSTFSKGIGCCKLTIGFVAALPGGGN